MKINDYLRYLVENGGSDLHIKAGNHPIIRKDGELLKIDGREKMTAVEMEEIVKPLMSESVKRDLIEKLGSDFSYSIHGVARFRMNLSTQRGSYMLVARIIPSNIPDIDEMKLPSVLKEIVKERNGIILVTGATGSGKSTTVASMINYVNKNFSKNIITFEDPIEFLYRDEKSIVSQKEIPNDILDFTSALRYVLRQDPDVIFIGELRDKETVEAALKASETGHLVISTLHTINASQTISRVVDFFPQEKHKQIKFQLSENIRGVISQRLLPKKEGGRVAALEIMINTPTIKELIQTNEGVVQIPKYIEEGREIYKSQSFDQNIRDLYMAGLIDYETALEYATVKKNIEFLKNGISLSSSADFFNSMY
jgi:twitching motility protein PilT